MSQPVSVNSVVGLCYLSPNKDENLYVRARIYHDTTNALLATKDLTHIEDGRYTDATFFMPNNKIKVRYDVYEDAGYTQEACDEGSVDERFHPLETPSDIIRNDEISLTFTEDDSESFIIDFVENDSFDLQFFDTDESVNFEFSENSGEGFDVEFIENDSFDLQFNECGC